MAKIEVRDVDITTLDVDAIANAANSFMLHGGGVAAAISRAGGPSIDHESQARAPVPIGQAIHTTGGDMPCRHVIHAVTMKQPAGETSAEIIRQATRATLRAADELGARSLALVAFGAGVGGFPVEEAARIEVEELHARLERGSVLEQVIFAVRGDRAREAFEAAL